MLALGSPFCMIHHLLSTGEMLNEFLIAGEGLEQKKRILENVKLIFLRKKVTDLTRVTTSKQKC